MVPLPETTKTIPAFDVWVEFIGYIRWPNLLPGSPDRVVEGQIYHSTGLNALIQETTQRLGAIGIQGGLMALLPDEELKKARPREGLILTPQDLLNPVYRRFVPLWNIKYIDTVIKPMTELPRVEEPGVPLTGSGVETKEHKPS